MRASTEAPKPLQRLRGQACWEPAQVGGFIEEVGLRQGLGEKELFNKQDQGSQSGHRTPRTKAESRDLQGSGEQVNKNTPNF